MRVTFAQFKKAVKVFGGDYAIVNHAELKSVAPWEEPNEDGVYSVTQIPRGVSELDFLARVQGVTDIVVTCMDKDVAHSTWEKMSRGKGKKVMMLTWGGGVVQHGSDRVAALSTVARYFADLYKAGMLPKLSVINADDHDHVCGAVKFWVGESLPDLLTKMLGRKVTPQSSIEDEVMEALIRDGAFVWVHEFAGTKVKVVSHLHATKRENKKGSKLVSVDLDPNKPLMNVGMLVEMRKLVGKKK